MLLHNKETRSEITDVYNMLQYNIPIHERIIQF